MMAFALLGIGLLLFIAAYHNNVAALGSQVYSDLTGSQGFIVWVAAIFIIGMIGYIPALKSISRVFLVLILVVVFLSNKGFFTTLQQVITSTGPSTPTTTPDATADSTQNNSTAASSTSESDKTQTPDNSSNAQGGNR